MNTQPAIRFGLLSTCFTSESVASLLKGPETHTAAVSFAAQLAYFSNEKEHLCEIVRSAFPPGYDGANIAEVPKFVDTAVEKYFGKRRGSEKRKTIGQHVLDAIDLTGAALFFDDQKRSYLSVATPGGGRLNLPVRSSAAEQWVRATYYKSAGAVISAHAYEEVIATLEARASVEGGERKVFLRVGGDHNEVEVDLGAQNGDVVKIDANGWYHETLSTVSFYRSIGMMPLPVPRRSKNGLKKFLRFLGLDRSNTLRVLGFLVACLNPAGPYMCLVVEGEQGSGKSFLCKLIKLTLDPHRLNKTRIPDNVRDLMIYAQEHKVLLCDNASGMSQEMSDAFCSLATDGGYATRRLYYDAELQYFFFCRPFIINGISDFVRRPDLQQRAIVVRLPEPPAERRTEADLLAEFDKILPAALGALYDAVACAIQNYEATPTPQTLRMADTARWLMAAEPALPVKPGEMLAAIEEAQTELMVETIVNDPLALALNRLTAARSFEGTVGDLFAEITTELPDGNRHLPKTPQHLSGALKRQKTALRKAGIEVEFVGHANFGMVVRISSAK